MGAGLTQCGCEAITMYRALAAGLSVALETLAGLNAGPTSADLMRCGAGLGLGF